MNFRCKFRHHHSILRPQFSIRVQNFGDLVTYSIDFCILYSECPPYFSIRFVWPSDLESIPHASTPTSIISNKFEDDIYIHCRVIAFLSADTSRDLVTLTFDLLTWNSCSAWRVTWPKCIRGHCASAESRHLWVGGQKQLHSWNPRPRFAYSLCNFGGSTMKVIKVICENNSRPCVDAWVSAHTRNQVIHWRCD